MKLGCCVLFAFLLWSPLVLAGGDTLDMKDGTEIEGNIVTQNAQQIYIDTKDKGLRRVDLSEIKTIHFGPVENSRVGELPPDVSPSPADSR